MDTSFKYIMMAWTIWAGSRSVMLSFLYPLASSLCWFLHLYHMTASSLLNHHDLKQLRTAAKLLVKPYHERVSACIVTSNKKTEPDQNIWNNASQYRILVLRICIQESGKYGRSKVKFTDPHYFASGKCHVIFPTILGWAMFVRG